MKIRYCDKGCLDWWFWPIQSIQHCLRVICRIYTSIPQVMETGYFDTVTQQAVEAFQREFELEPSGKVDYDTWQVLVFVYKNLEAICVGPGCYNLGVPQGEIVVLQQGDDNCCQLEILQSVLNHFAKTYDNMPAVEQNNQYDSSTTAAVRNFQRLAHLPESGVLDRRTWNMMLKSYSNCMSN